MKKWLQIGYSFKSEVSQETFKYLVATHEQDEHGYNSATCSFNHALRIIRTIQTLHLVDYEKSMAPSRYNLVVLTNKTSKREESTLKSVFRALSQVIFPQSPPCSPQCVPHWADYTTKTKPPQRIMGLQASYLI